MEALRRSRRPRVGNAIGAALMRGNARKPPRLLRRPLERLGKKLFRSTIRVDDGFVFSAYGVWLKHRPDDRTFNFSLVGSYGFFLSRYIAGQDQPFIFLDVGANVGLYSAIAASNPRILAIHAFEPDPATLPYLRANLEETARSEWVIHPVALSDQVGLGQLSTSSQHSGIATLRSNDLGDQPFDGAVQVELRDHTYLDESVSLPNRPARILVKIDVEGHELHALRALVAWRDWPSVFAVYVELDTVFSETARTRALLESQGFYEQQRVGTDVHSDVLYVRNPASGS